MDTFTTNVQVTSESGLRNKAPSGIKKENITRKNLPQKKSNLALWIGLGVAGIVLISALVGWLVGGGMVTIFPAGTSVFTQTVTMAQTPTSTNTPSATNTPKSTNTPQSTATPKFTIGSTITGNDGMTLLYVPEGEFKMGVDLDDMLAKCQKHNLDCKSDWFTSEEPQHSVYLGSFWIDQTEVTNEEYKKCVDAGECKSPETTNHFLMTYYINHPVTYVSWNDANTYCLWADRRLPTEAEWEKAASWDDKNKMQLLYPSGESLDCSVANYWNKDNVNGCTGDTTPVKSYKTNKSPYGAYDMVGNVEEWVNDWYSETYYQNSPSSNPLGPNSGQYRVLRGGSYYSWDIHSFSGLRFRQTPDITSYQTGFRCALSAP